MVDNQVLHGDTPWGYPMGRQADYQTYLFVVLNTVVTGLVSMWFTPAGLFVIWLPETPRRYSIDNKALHCTSHNQIQKLMLWIGRAQWYTSMGVGFPPNELVHGRNHILCWPPAMSHHHPREWNQLVCIHKRPKLIDGLIGHATKLVSLSTRRNDFY
jgi:hypothetical protein